MPPAFSKFKSERACALPNPPSFYLAISWTRIQNQTNLPNENNVGPACRWTGPP
jgi:hypothetical protein